jgi:tetratricopeptide (TPR) repeat protein
MRVCRFWFPWLRPVAAAAVALLLLGCGSAQERYADHIARAQGYLAAGELGKASVEFRNALRIKPSDPEALYQLGYITEQRGGIRDGIRLYQAAIEAAPEDLRPRARLGAILILGAAPQRALQVVEPGLARQPDDPDLLAVRAAAHSALKDDAAARADAERAVQVAPTNAHAVEVLSTLEAQAGDLPAAINLVSSAVAKVPDAVVLHELLAALYMRSAQPDKAEEQLRRIVALEPQALEPRVRLARFLSQSHQPDAAQQVLEQAVRDLPRSDEAKLVLTDFVATQRSRQQGEEVLRDFIAADPGSADLRFGLGALLERSGATDEAVAVYQQVIGRNGKAPDGLVARDRIAAIELARGHRTAAQALIAEVLRENSRDNAALTLRAELALLQGDPTTAIADLRAVLQDQPHSIPLQRQLARAYVANNEPALAEAALRNALQDAPADLAVSLDLAQLLIDTRRDPEAVALLSDCVRRFPQELLPRQLLVQADLAKGDLDAARAAAEDLKKLRPEAAQGFYLAGLVAAQQRHLAEAQQNLEQALALQPGAADILAAYVRLLRTHGQGAQALERVRQASESQPQNVQVLELLGQLYLDGGDQAHAAAIFVQAIELDPTWWVPYRDLGLVRLAQSDPKGAIAQYEAALRVAPRQPQLLVGLAALYEKQGRIDDAIARYEALYASEPRLRQFAANNLAMMLVTYKKDAASLDRARALTRGFDSSGDGSLLDTHAWVRFKRGEYQDAVTELQRAAERAPDSKEIRYHLGMAELETGQLARARTDLEEALSGAASFAGADEARQKLASLKTNSGG